MPRKRKAGSTGAIAATVIERVKLAEMNPAPYNPRKELKPGDPEWDRIERSLESFGMVEVLVWNRRTGNLVAGHQRRKVLLAHGATEADVSVVDLPIEREKLLNIAMNRVTGAWDDVKLGDLLAELDAQGGIDLSLTGIEHDELEALLEEASDGATPGGEPRSDGGEGDGSGSDGEAKAGIVDVAVGQFRFEVSEAEFKRWVVKLQAVAGYGERKAVTEIRKRLGFGRVRK